MAAAITCAVRRKPGCPHDHGHVVLCRGFYVLHCRVGDGEIDQHIGLFAFKKRFDVLCCYDLCAEETARAQIDPAGQFEIRRFLTILPSVWPMRQKPRQITTLTMISSPRLPFCGRFFLCDSLFCSRDRCQDFF